MAEKNSAQTNKQTDKQTKRHYENNGHLAVNQLKPPQWLHLVNVSGVYCGANMHPCKHWDLYRSNIYYSISSLFFT